MSKNRNQQQRHALSVSTVKDSLTPESTECSALNADATFEAVSATNKLELREFFKPPALDNPYGINAMQIDHEVCNYRDWETDRKSTRLNSSHRSLSRMPSSA